MKWLVAVLICLSTACHAAAPAQVITWMLYDWPPIYIIPTWAPPRTVNELGNGIGDHVLTALIQELPQYEHRFQRANLTRIFSEMQQGNPVCYATALRTPERERFAYFSPVQAMPPIHVVLREDTARKLAGTGGSIALAQLQSAGLRGLYELKRSYGKVLDGFIQQQQGKIQAQQSEGVRQLLLMVESGQSDYAFEYPFVVEYLRRQSAFRSGVSMLAINDNNQALLMSNVACTRSPWGRKVIADIDGAIRRGALKPLLRQATSGWLAPEIQQRYQTRFDAFYDARVRAPDISPP
ncbi:conserved hypothetical protein [Andreprevotia lacus DSM 23236]|uniref:TIGR02285 family protein n=1 Tax=Andreprevotia lacus DSM 23236 TaxID=1121001 RepID=A0A1W1X2K5_9NEIS|nr:TIGR02285 family protein [Andreprevotia lacus]SMC17641.1 conserved hypothetical protein [Andreprevotia lacus DSM 23236]